MLRPTEIVFSLGPQKWCFLDSENKFPVFSAPNVASISKRGSLAEDTVIELKLDKLMPVQYIAYVCTSSNTVAL